MRLRTIIRHITAGTVALAAAGPAHAQLRPLEPTDWRAFTAASLVMFEVGGGAFQDQRASLAGSEGRLLEVGNFRATWRTGRVVLEAAGTGQRFFREDSRFAEPEPFVETAGRHRHDSGDYRVATIVRVTGDRSPILGVVRFGARLPTTDNKTGLDRDATDFFALLGGSVARGSGSLSAEGGVSINGTRVPTFEQSDVFTYAARAEYSLGAFTPSLQLVGQMDGLKDRTVRGNEDLGEVRVGLRAGERRWLRAELVAGYTAFSPRTGILLTVGMAP